MTVYPYFVNTKIKVEGKCVPNTKKNVVVVIPARGGSKRIPKKNVKKFKGLPLMCHMIHKCRDIEKINGIYVSTENNKIASIAMQCGAQVIKRPRMLSKDYVATLPVLWHAAFQIYDWDVMIHIQPNSPNLKSELIEEAIEMLTKKGYSEVATRFPDDDENEEANTLWGFTKERLFTIARFDKITNRVVLVDDSTDIDTKVDWKKAEEEYDCLNI